VPEYELACLSEPKVELAGAPEYELPEYDLAEYASQSSHLVDSISGAAL
jgi:hypothetical protein